MSKGTVRLIEIAAGVITIAAIITIALVFTERLHSQKESSMPVTKRVQEIPLKEYTNTQYKFAFKYPKDLYTLTEINDTGGNVLFNVNLMNNKSKMSVWLSVYHMDRPTLVQYINAQADGSGSESPIFYRIENAKQSKLNEYESMELLLSPQGDTPYAYAVAFSRGDKAYLFFSYYDYLTSEGNDQKFEQMVNSFRFIE